MDSSKNAEKFKICGNKSVTDRESTAKHTRYLAYFSGNGKENFPKENFIQ